MGAFIDQHPVAVLGWLALAALAVGAIAVLGFLAAAVVNAHRHIRAERPARTGLDSRPDMSGLDRLDNAIRNEQGDQ